MQYVETTYIVYKQLTWRVTGLEHPAKFMTSMCPVKSYIENHNYLYTHIYLTPWIEHIKSELAKIAITFIAYTFGFFSFKKVFKNTEIYLSLIMP